MGGRKGCSLIRYYLSLPEKFKDYETYWKFVIIMQGHVKKTFPHKIEITKFYQGYLDKCIFCY